MLHDVKGTRLNFFWTDNRASALVPVFSRTTDLDLSSNALLVPPHHLLVSLLTTCRARSASDDVLSNPIGLFVIRGNAFMPSKW